MVRVSGFGQTGPYAQRAGYGSIGEAMGGLRYVVGHPDKPPSRVGISIGDALAATNAYIGALLALQVRNQTGRGQIVDSAIYEAVLGMMESLVPEYCRNGQIRERSGSILPNVAPSNVYPTRDGEHLIAANQDTVFSRLATAMGRPELGDDPRFCSHGARGEHQEELDTLIAAWTASLTCVQLEERLSEYGVPNGKIYTAPDMLDDPHFHARDAIVSVSDPNHGELKMQNVFPKLSESQGSIRSLGPSLGEHNREIYEGLLALSADQISELEAKGII
jgi:formyl-CoA transferase